MISERNESGLRIMQDTDNKIYKDEHLADDESQYGRFLELVRE